ncbi:MAG: TIGR03905 family TSCPD domain-containing protein [Succinivibrio sp.]|nr:TIGR03905 family TSCPD domain-containing protein [Succinivibrio sp.]
MHYQYKTQGTCSKLIDFDLEDGIIHNVEFTGGCNGNLKGISRLVEGKDAAQIAALLRGNTCRAKSTSCPDQLAKALLEALRESANS